MLKMNNEIILFTSYSIKSIHLRNILLHTTCVYYIWLLIFQQNDIFESNEFGGENKLNEAINVLEIKLFLILTYKSFPSHYFQKIIIIW